MAKREQIEEALDRLPDSELEPVLEFIVSRGSSSAEMTSLPEGWDRMANGDPMPNIAAALRRSREGH